MENAENVVQTPFLKIAFSVFLCCCQLDLFQLELSFWNMIVRNEKESLPKAAAAENSYISDHFCFNFSINNNKTTNAPAPPPTFLAKLSTKKSLVFTEILISRLKQWQNKTRLENSLWTIKAKIYRKWLLDHVEKSGDCGRKNCRNKCQTVPDLILHKNCP